MTDAMESLSDQLNARVTAALRGNDDQVAQARAMRDLRNSLQGWASIAEDHYNRLVAELYASGMDRQELKQALGLGGPLPQFFRSRGLDASGLPTH